MNRPVALHSNSMRGMVLIGVLWMVAALTLLATGALHAVRAEIRVVATLKESARATAHGDAVLRLAAAALSAPASQRDRYLRLDTQFDGQPITVHVIPVSGLVNLNQAAESLLADVFIYAGGLGPEAARAAAQRIIDWRDPDPTPHAQGAEDSAYEAAGVVFRTRGRRFEVVEDLLQVLGIDFDLYVKVASLFTADGSGAGVDPLAAPPAVLHVLARGNMDVVERIVAARAADGRLADTSGLVSAHVAKATASRFLLEAHVPVDAAAIVVRSHLIDVSPQRDMPLPWRILGVDTRYLSQDR